MNDLSSLSSFDRVSLLSFIDARLALEPDRPTSREERAHKSRLFALRVGLSERDDVAWLVKAGLDPTAPELPWRRIDRHELALEDAPITGPQPPTLDELRANLGDRRLARFLSEQLDERRGIFRSPFVTGDAEAARWLGTLGRHATLVEIVRRMAKQSAEDTHPIFSAVVDTLFGESRAQTIELGRVVFARTSELGVLRRVLRWVAGAPLPSDEPLFVSAASLPDAVCRYLAIDGLERLDGAPVRALEDATRDESALVQVRSQAALASRGRGSVAAIVAAAERDRDVLVRAEAVRHLALLAPRAHLALFARLLRDREPFDSFYRPVVEEAAFGLALADHDDARRVLLDAFLEGVDRSMFLGELIVDAAHDREPRFPSYAYRGHPDRFFAPLPDWRTRREMALVGSAGR